jgi:hypothetical protein
VRINIPPMLFMFNANPVNWVKVRTGSRVPVIAQRRTNTHSKHKLSKSAHKTRALFEQQFSHDTTNNAAPAHAAR